MRAEGQPQPLESFLRHVGFRFNPFQYLEATEDPHVGDYLVGLDSFTVAWDPCPALIFAPTGGGKTAMRVYTIQSSWFGLGGPHAFPVSCTPRLSSPSHFELNQEEIFAFLVRWAARDLFLGLAHRPQRFMELGATDALKVVSLWRHALGKRFHRALLQLEDTGDPTRLVPILDPAYRIRGKPAVDQVFEFCQAVRRADRGQEDLSPAKLWSHFLSLALGALGFSSIYLLFDGLDALPETHSHPELGLAWFRSFWRHAPQWAQERVYIKGFLPAEYQDIWTRLAPREFQGQRSGSLMWTPALLAEMLRRRVAVATGGKAGSLDAFSSPGLRDVEMALVQELSPPAPREALALTQKVLEAWRQRNTQATLKPGQPTERFLDRQGIERGKQMYQEERMLSMVRRATSPTVPKSP